MNYEITDYEVLTVEEVKTPTKTCIIKKHYTFVKHIKLSSNGNIINVQWVDWEGNELPFETTTLKLSGDVEEQEITLEEPQLELEGEGLNIIVESINPKVKNDKIEVSL